MNWNLAVHGLRVWIRVLKRAAPGEIVNVRRFPRHRVCSLNAGEAEHVIESSIFQHEDEHMLDRSAGRCCPRG